MLTLNDILDTYLGEFTQYFSLDGETKWPLWSSYKEYFYVCLALEDQILQVSWILPNHPYNLLRIDLSDPDGPQILQDKLRSLNINWEC